MNVDLARLLDRPATAFDPDRSDALLRGARVLITGAGGSIGSDLCHRVVGARPEVVVLLERHENSLYELLTGLQDLSVATPVVPTLTDVTDASRLDALFARHRPDIVFHAAAHKHVSLMQDHACEAARNNVVGTHVVARAAAAHGASRFVLVSTDKAADAVGVMGLTKAAAETCVQAMAARGHRTRFATVRLGNVLGSAGSVVPRFLGQIQRGGPVTVRDPRATRHFLLASEAVGLITLAAALAGPEYRVYAPDLGAPVNIGDLARAVIREATGRADAVRIVHTRLLSGEKLAEALVASDEQMAPSGISHVSCILPRPLDEDTDGWLSALERAAAGDDEEGVLRYLSQPRTK